MRTAQTELVEISAPEILLIGVCGGSGHFHPTEGLLTFSVHSFFIYSFSRADWGLDILQIGLEV